MKVKRLVVLFVTAVFLMSTGVLLIGCSEDKEQETISRYNITAELNDTDMTLSAVCNISYVNRTEVELSEVWFHLYPAAYRENARYAPVPQNEVLSAYPAGVSYGGIEITEVEGGEYEIAGLDEDILIVTLPDSVYPTQSVDITISYVLTLPHIKHRLGYDNGVINLGNWFPIECVYDCGFTGTPYYSNGDPFNLPVCDYGVSITAPEKYVVVMPGKAERTKAGDKAITSCTIKKARDFAAVLGEFNSVSNNVCGTEVTYYYVADDNAREHLKTACDSLEYFSDIFCDYPYKTYSVVLTPFNQGGMEYSGLVYVSDAASGNMVDEIIIHETAHQWWYGIVGNDQINHAWLDEALAEYSTTLFYENHSDYGVKYDDRIADAMSGFSLYCELSRCEDTSMNRAVQEYGSAGEYTYMTYVKGQLMYDGLKTMLGEKTLINGLKGYIKACSYKTAVPDDLIASLEKASGRELKAYINSYVSGSAKLYSIGG